MNWFKRKKSGYRVKGTGYSEEKTSDSQLLSPKKRCTLFRAGLLSIFLALFTGILLIRAGALQSAPAAVVFALVVLGIGIRSGMLVFGVADKIVVEQHDDNNQTKCAHNAQHNDHDYSPFFSIVRIRKSPTKNANTAQNINFSADERWAKNSPAKYPARIILAKSPMRPAISSLDFDVNHFISVCKNIMSLNVCQLGFVAEART